MTAEFIVSGTPEVEFSLQPLEPRKKKTVEDSARGIPETPDRTTRIEMAFGFTGERHDDRHDT